MGFLVVFFLMTGSASAVTYGFENITANNPIDAVIGESQLFLNVEAFGDSDQVLFKFSNSGPEDASITDIYFDDDVPMLSFADFIYSTSGVDYTEGASPGNLPGGNSFNFSSNYSYDSDSPTQPSGVNPGEALGILFNLNNDATGSAYEFADIIQALDNGPMMVGIHVQGFAGEGSESFIATPTTVPEPATLFMVGSGLLLLVAFSRRKLKKS